MICLIDKILDEAGMKSHASMLETFFVYLGCLYANFQEKKNLPLNVWEKVPNITSMKSLELFPDVLVKIFAWKFIWLHPLSVQNFVYQASHCSALPIG